MERLARLTSHFPSNEVDGNSVAVSVHRVSASTPDSGFNVALLGAAGGIGQPLGLLLKMSHMIKELRLYDVVNTAGVAADLSHINTPARTLSFSGQEQLPAALYGAHLVVIPAGVPRKPGMTRDDLFNINAGIVKTLVDGVAKYCPTAWVAIISNPVNSTVPIAAEVLKSHGVYNPRRLFGVTTLDVVRANTFGAEVLGGSTKVEVPVIGGHAGITILPILSAAKPPIILPEEKAKALIARIQDAGTEVVQAKAGAGSATLSMAYAAAEFANSCLRAMGGVTGIIECTYVSSQVTDLPFFASQVVLGQNGIEEYLPLPVMNPVEREAFDKMKSELKASIDKGLAFAARR